MKTIMMKSLFCISAIFLICTAIGFAKPNGNKPITIMTLNLANYNDHAYWDERLAMIADEIQKNHADIIALQETRFDPGHPSSQRTYQDMAQQILYLLNTRGDYLDATVVTQPVMYYPNRSRSSALGMHAYPLPANLSPTGQSFYWEGLSIISKLPIQETGSVFLSMPSNCTDINQRNTQYIKVENQGKPLYIANIHFAYHQPCTITNAQETMKYLNPIVKDQAMLMLGDFNATPASPIFPMLTAEGMTDMWLKLRPQDPGDTSNSSYPTKRIDFILANAAALRDMNGSESIKLVCDKSKGGLFCSDHNGVALTY